MKSNKKSASKTPKASKSTTADKKDALSKLKYEVASELGVSLNQGYNGDLTAKQAGSIGGYMVKKMVEAQSRSKSKSS
jgi:hypothetical protein